MAVKRQRFEHFTEEQIKKKRQSTVPKATLKSNDKWERAFRSYLQEKGLESTEYWYYPEDELDDILSHFWFEAHTQRPLLSNEEKHQAIPNPDRYTIASLRNMRNGLLRCLVEHGKNIDLTTDDNIRKSQWAFKDACKELKHIGKGTVNSYPEIEHSGNEFHNEFLGGSIFPIF